MGYGMLMAHARAFLPPHLLGRGVTLMNFFSIGGVGMMQFATGAVVTANVVPSRTSGRLYRAVHVLRGHSGHRAFDLPLRSRCETRDAQLIPQHRTEKCEAVFG